MGSKSVHSPLAIGVDIGGTGTKFGIVDRDGNVLFSGEISTKKHTDVNSFMDDLYSSLIISIEKAGGIGRM
jgi:glucokinase